MRLRILAVFCFAAALPAFARTTSVTLLHFSDYHSHAVPFFSEGQPDQGGIARAIAYLAAEKKKPNTFVFSGGDMINKGSPAWSDKFGCAEWEWLNGIVDAMAFGNHDSDYAAESFSRCRSAVSYPILGANAVGPDGAPLFLDRGRPYSILRVGNIRIGVIALAGSDFEKLVRADSRPVAGARFTDRTEAARKLVRELRGRERVSAVVLIGHAHREEDIALAKSVPGIDLIFGTHSHIKEELSRIPGTQTWFISPYQYLAYVSRVELVFRGKKLAGVRGGLVRIGSPMEPDLPVAERVAGMQRALEEDPAYAPLFARIGAAGCELSLSDQLQSETVLGNLVTGVMRHAAQADFALSTTSSFRQPIPPGPVLFEDLRASLPYPNRILVYSMNGSDVRRLFQRVIDRRGTDGFAQFAGARVTVRSGRVTSITTPLANFDWGPLMDSGGFGVATTDYMAGSAAYKDLFEGHEFRDTGLEVREEIRKFIEREGTVCAEVDGRLKAVDR